MNPQTISGSIATDERVTPRWLIEEVVQRFGPIVLDAAATAENAVCWRYYGPDQEKADCRDGLVAPWNYDQLAIAPAIVWCNPPYSRGSILQWCQKATEEAAKGVTTVMLLSADTSTRYFHEFVLPNEHYFLRRRLKFEGAPLDGNGRLAAAKFGSVLVVFRPEASWARG